MPVALPRRAHRSSLIDDRITSVNAMTNASIPSGLWPHFQEYDPRRLDREQDADLIVQRTLEHGTWEEDIWSE